VRKFKRFHCIVGKQILPTIVMQAMIHSKRLSVSLILPIFLVACAGRATPTNLYIPPTGAAMAAQSTRPTQMQTGGTPGDSQLSDSELPSPTSACVPGLAFIEDLTIPDGSLVSPGESLDKRWRVENIGSCNWDASFSVRLIAGPELGMLTDQALFPARSGSPATIRALFTAPSEPGTYRSAWQAHDPLGQPFGDPFFIEITVASPEN
jgi:hypothetical protein